MNVNITNIIGLLTIALIIFCAGSFMWVLWCVALYGFYPYSYHGAASEAVHLVWNFFGILSSVVLAMVCLDCVDRME